MENEQYFFKQKKLKHPLLAWFFILSIIVFLLDSMVCFGQQKKMSIAEVVQLAVANSHSIELLKSGIVAANTRYKQAKDNATLPSGSMNVAFSHAEIPANHIVLGSVDWVLPKHATSYTGGFTVTETLFDGFKRQYAINTAKLMEDLSKLDLEKNKDQVILSAVEMYSELYKVTQSLEVTALNITSIDSMIAQAAAFFQTGIVTKNDVLRFQLQKSTVKIIAAGLTADYEIVNYNLVVLLGLPENTRIIPGQIIADLTIPDDINQQINQATSARAELQQTDLYTKLDSLSVKSIKANTLPKLQAISNLNYIHAGTAFIPAAGSFIAPFSIGAKASWDFSSLWFNKNKLSTARVIQQQHLIEKKIVADAIKMEVHACYQQYLKALQKIDLLQEAIAQAGENNMMQAEKYKHNIVAVTDRIDADTKLYDAMTNLEIAKADAGVAWYRLLKSTGKISK
jgi:outer membrane protein